MLTPECLVTLVRYSGSYEADLVLRDITSFADGLLEGLAKSYLFNWWYVYIMYMCNWGEPDER